MLRYVIEQMYPIWKVFGTYLRSLYPGSETEPISIVAWDGGSTFIKKLLATVTHDGHATIKHTHVSTSLPYFKTRPTIKTDDTNRLYFMSLSSINEAGGDHEAAWADLMDNMSECVMLKKLTDGHDSTCVINMKKKMIVAGNHPDYIQSTGTEDVFQYPVLPRAIGTEVNGLYGLGKDRYFRKTDIIEQDTNGDEVDDDVECSYEFLYGVTTRFEAKRILSNGSGPTLVVFGIPTWSTYAERFDFYYKIYSLAFKGLGHCFVGVSETDATMMASAMNLESSGRILCIDLGGEYTMISIAEVVVTFVNGHRRVTVNLIKRLSLPFGQTSVMQWILSRCDTDGRHEFISYHLEEIILKMADCLPDLFKEAEDFGLSSSDVQLGFGRLNCPDNRMITRLDTQWVINCELMFLANLFGILRQENMLNSDVSCDDILHVQFVGKTSNQQWFQKIAKSFLAQLPSGYLRKYNPMFDDCMTTTGLLEVGKSMLLSPDSNDALLKMTSNAAEAVQIHLFRHHRNSRTVPSTGEFAKPARVKQGWIMFSVLDVQGDQTSANESVNHDLPPGYPCSTELQNPLWFIDRVTTSVSKTPYIVEDLRKPDDAGILVFPVKFDSDCYVESAVFSYDHLIIRIKDQDNAIVIPGFHAFHMHWNRSGFQRFHVRLMAMLSVVPDTEIVTKDGIVALFEALLEKSKYIQMESLHWKTELQDLLNAIVNIQDPDAWMAFTTPTALNFASVDENIKAGARVPFGGQLKMDVMDMYEIMQWRNREPTLFYKTVSNVTVRHLYVLLHLFIRYHTNIMYG